MNKKLTLNLLIMCKKSFVTQLYQNFLAWILEKKKHSGKNTPNVTLWPHFLPLAHLKYKQTDTAKSYSRKVFPVIRHIFTISSILLKQKSIT